MLDCERMGKSNTCNAPRIKNSAWFAEESVEEEVWNSSMLHVFSLGVCSFKIAPRVRGERWGGGVGLQFLHTYIFYLFGVLYNKSEYIDYFQITKIRNDKKFLTIYG